MGLVDFSARRNKVFSQMQDNSIALLTAAPTQYRNSDTEYPYRQESHFYYLTGFDESDAIAILVKKQGETRFILFCQERDKQVEQWTGQRVGVIGAREIFAADEAYPITEASLRLPDLLAGTSIVYYLVNANRAFSEKIFSWLGHLRKKNRQGVTVPHQFIDLSVILDELRLFKSEQEIDLMQHVCEISAKAHCEAMLRCQPGLYEYALEAVLLYEFYRQGAHAVAYSSIVAGGNNACTLHYTRNESQLLEGQLVLIDAGAEIKGYAADITRTFPVNGRFSASQQAIYELVLASQVAAINCVSPQVTWDKIQQTILTVLVTGLVDLKILQGDPKTLIEEKAYLPFYMHSSGHWLGLDVHDVGEYKQQGNWRALLPGMVFTIEPGLYISADNQEVAEKWRGIGVRIEDDILLTDKGVKVLTQGVPKTVVEIENLMKNKQS